MQLGKRQSIDFGIIALALEVNGKSEEINHQEISKESRTRNRVESQGK